MEFETAQNNTTAKLPILKLGEYEMWEIRIKQYFQVQDYALWEVIENGNSWVYVPQTLQENGTSVTKMLVPVTAEEKINKKNDVKARSLLLMALPNEHQLTFSSKSFIDDLYNNFKIVEQDVKKFVGASTGTQNMAFMTTPSTSSTNDINTANSASIVSTVSPNVNTASSSVSTANINDNVVYAFMVKNPNALSAEHEGKESVSTVIRWDTLPGNVEHQETKMAMLAIDGVGYDWSDMAEDHIQTNMALMAFSDSELLKREVGCKDYEIGMLKTEFEKIMHEKEGIDFKTAKFDDASKCLDKLLESQITNKSKKDLGYHVVAPPYPLSLNAPTKLDLSYLEQVSDNENSSVESLPNVVKKTIFHAAKKVEFFKPKNNEKPVKKLVSFDHMKINCPHRQRKRMVTGNNYNRVDYDYYAKTSHTTTHRIMTPRAVLLKTALKPLSTVRPIYIVYVYSAKSMSQFSKQAQSTLILSGQIGSMLSSPQHVRFGDLPDLMVHHLFSTDITTLMHEADPSSVDSGCSRHMTRNIAYLSNFKEYDGGYVTFGGGACGGRISGKGTLKTDSLDFDDLPDENQILLKIPREDNMYSFDMKTIVPKESLTCLVAKATLDESMLWHRRLGHINFKNINKLVKDNLVRGLPLKLFENDQTCVACLKGKQHRASCKSNVLNPITKPLFMLHMDLFLSTL
ncbi:putative ribonuclease H-like domain-containing protein [Tanacetum coccineum]